MEEWRKVRLSDFLTLYRIEHQIQDDKTYQQVTISKNHGISFRGSKLGKNIGRKRQFIVDLKTYPNTMLFTRQGVRDGAIGIAPPEVDQCIVTENMPMMSVNTNAIEIAYLKKLLLSEYLYEKIQLLTVVGSAQKSIHEKDLLNIQIGLPTLELQKIECKRFDVLDVENGELKQELTHQQSLLKKLRQQILQEAIEGKLSQDWRAENPNAEPAGKLLKRIQAEKQQLIKDKKIKNQKPLPAISEAEKPFELPEGWAWCRLGDLLNKFSTGPFGSMLHKSDYVPGGIPLVNPTNIVNGAIIPNRKMMIDQRTKKRLSKYILKVGEFIIARRGDLSKCAVIGKQEDGWLCGTGSFFIEPSKNISKEFFMKTYRSCFFQKQLADTSVGSTMANLNQKILNESLFPLPPLAEQKAIVAKVEKLLSLCDQLQAQITQNQSHADGLMQAVLTAAFSQGNNKARQRVLHGNTR